MESFEDINRRTKDFGPWSDLPPELLTVIAKKLSLIDVLAFRGTCKTWFSATSEADELGECDTQEDPSFIVCDNQAKTSTFYYKTCDGSYKKYSTMNISELEDADCLASDQGWMLLHRQGSLFFFNPFSRARIDLPEFPESDLSGHVAAFSAPPTNRKCIVALGKNTTDLESMAMHIIRRGESQWTQSKCSHGKCVRDLKAAVYVEDKGSFYFVGYENNKMGMLRFSVVDEVECWSSYNIIARETAPPGTEIMRFSYDRYFFGRSAIKEQMELEDDALISICGTTLHGDQDKVTCVLNEKVEARSGTAAKSLKGIWVQPRFVQIPENQGWNL